MAALDKSRGKAMEALLTLAQKGAATKAAKKKAVEKKLAKKKAEKAVAIAAKATEESESSNANTKGKLVKEPTPITLAQKGAATKAANKRIREEIAAAD
ncbi:hypothetical protein LTR74_018291 [Friedmanniomyces endolithicus]|nr:hypothetical protein LTR74_018291 [Friedmanniomyces endolithicus]